MYKKQLITFAFIWILIVSGSCALLYFSLNDSEKRYQELIRLTDHDKSASSVLNEGVTGQKREFVSKQILYKKGEERLQAYLKSDLSDLIYSKNSGELVEYFKGLNCIMQDALIETHNGKENGLFPNNEVQQKVRQLKACDALYSYKTGKVEAKEAEIFHFFLPGNQCPHLLNPDGASFQGKATHLQFLLMKEPCLEGQGFEAVFHDWGF